MAKRPQATVHLTAWKQHCCVQCDSTFRYQEQRSTTVAGDTEEAAAARARFWGEKELTAALCRPPCPVCGTLQPGRVSQRLVGYHLLVTVLAFSIPAPLVAVLLERKVAGLGVVSFLAATSGCLVLIGHILVLRHHPNQNPAANLVRGSQQDGVTKLEILQTGHGDERLATQPRPVNTWQRAGIGLLALGVLVLALVDLVNRLRILDWRPDELMGKGALLIAAGSLALIWGAHLMRRKEPPGIVTFIDG